MKLCTSQLMYLSHYLPPKKVYLKPDDNLLLLLVDCVGHYGYYATSVFFNLCVVSRLSVELSTPICVYLTIICPI